VIDLLKFFVSLYVIDLLKFIGSLFVIDLLVRSLCGVGNISYIDDLNE